MDKWQTFFKIFLFHITLECIPQTLIGMSIAWDLAKMSIGSQRAALLILPSVAL